MKLQKIKLVVSNITEKKRIFLIPQKFIIYTANNFAIKAIKIKIGYTILVSSLLNFVFEY